MTADAKRHLRIDTALILLLSLLYGPMAVAGTDPPWMRQEPGSFRRVVLRDGLQVEVQRSSLVRVIGPSLPGEVTFMGNFVQGLLLPRTHGELASELEDCWRPLGATSADKRIRDELLVVLDPGHGGSQTGATGAAGTLEKDLVLDLARRIRKALGSLPGVEVIMTRLADDEIPLGERVSMANQLQADVFISIHANAFRNPRLGGVETFFHSIEASGEEAARVASFENAPGGEQVQVEPDTLSFILEDMQQAEKLRDSSRLAHLLQEQLAANSPFENRGVMQADFVVLRSTRMPSVLVELGFLTHPHDEKALRDTRLRDRLAGAIRTGLLQYWELLKTKIVRAPGADRR